MRVIVHASGVRLLLTVRYQANLQGAATPEFKLTEKNNANAKIKHCDNQGWTETICFQYSLFKLS